LTAFPPEDICGFLQLSSGEWLALRSLLDPEVAETLQKELGPAREQKELGEGWHQSERGEVSMAVLPAPSDDDWGGLEIALPDGSRQQLIFQRNGMVVINGISGAWQLSQDGSLALEIQEPTRIVRERIWYSKPNLRLRCTLEQFLDGRPGRASFSSEIRRVTRPQESQLPSPD
jgi:hypothetical protein